MLLFLVVIAVTVARQGATLLKKKYFRFFVESGTSYCFLLNACIRPFQGLGTPLFELAVKQPITKSRSLLSTCA